MRNKRKGQFYAIMIRLVKNKFAMTGLIILVLFVVIAVFAPWISPYSYTEMDIDHVFEGPSLKHWFGTDNLGRDIFSRLMYGTRYSLSLGIVSVVLSQACGLVIGCIAGYYGGTLEDVIMRVLDVIQSVPGTLLTITIATVFGSGFFNTILALSISHIPGSARNMRALVLMVRKMEYLEAAEACNCSDFRKILTHIVPNCLSYIIIGMTMATAYTILQAAGLSYIGLGVQPPTPEWGAMLTGARNYLRDYSYMLIFPGLCIGASVLSLNLLGDGLRDAMDPRLKK